MTWLTRMQNLLRFAMAGTERTVQFKMINVIQESVSDRKERIL